MSTAATAATTSKLPTPGVTFITPLSNDPSPTTYPKYSLATVSQHNTDASLWIIANGNIYDVTTFADEHPGGRKIMQTVAGKDASKQVNKYHRPQIIKRHEARLKIGEVEVEKSHGKGKGLGRLFGFGGKK